MACLNQLVRLSVQWKAAETCMHACMHACNKSEEVQPGSRTRTEDQVELYLVEMMIDRQWFRLRRRV